MKRPVHGVPAAGLLFLALAACTSDRGDMARTSSVYDSGRSEQSTGVTPAPGTSEQSTSSSSAVGSSGATGSTATGADQSGSMAPNSTVMNIEVMPRQEGSSTQAGTVAGAAVGGTAGGTTGADRVYRITLQLDNGDVKTLTQESPPNFSTGDRVRLSEGAIIK